MGFYFSLCQIAQLPKRIQAHGPLFLRVSDCAAFRKNTSPWASISWSVRLRGFQKEYKPMGLYFSECQIAPLSERIQAHGLLFLGVSGCVAFKKNTSPWASISWSVR